MCSLIASEIRGLETAVLTALIREVLSSVVPARIIDLMVLFIFALVSAKMSILKFANSEYSNERQVVHTICWP